MVVVLRKSRKKLSEMQETLTLLLCCLGFAHSFDLYFGCHWEIAAVNTMDAFKSVNKVSLNFQGPVDVTELLKDMTIYDYDICQKNPCFAYRYSFRLTISCKNEEFRQIMNQQAVAHRFLPFVTVCVNGYLSQKATQCSSYQGALFNQRLIGSCISGTNCEPFWMVPAVLEGRIFEVLVKMRGVGWPFDPIQLMYRISEFSQNSVDKPSGSANDYKELRNMKYVPIQSSVLVLGPYTKDNYFLISLDEFETVYATTYAQLVPQADRKKFEAKSACLCDDVPEIVTVVSFADSVILVTKYGVILTNGKSARVLTDNCVKQVSFGSRFDRAFLFLHGGCTEEGKIFLVVLSTSYNEVVSRNSTLFEAEGNPCKQVESSAVSCRIVEISASPGLYSYLALLLLGYADGTQNHALLCYEGVKWKTYLLLPSKVPLPQDLKIPLLLQKDVISAILGSKFKEEPLTLSGYLTAPFASHHIYLYGTHLLHSSDLGKHFFLLPTKFGGIIKVAVINRRGFMIIITDNNQIWSSALGISAVFQIFPSFLTDSVLQFRDMKLLPSKLQILSCIVDLKDNFILIVYSDQDGLSRYSMPVEELFYLHGQKQFSAPSVPSDTANETTVEYSESGCAFTSLRFHFPLSRLNTRTMHYTFYAPYLNRKNSYDKTSFLVYHAIIHYLKTKHSPITETVKTEYDVDMLLLNTSTSKQLYPQFLYWNDLLMENEFYANSADFTWDDARVSNELNLDPPELIYLDFNQSYTFTMILILPESSVNIDEIEFYIQLSDTSYVSSIVVPTKYSNNNSITYEVSLINQSPVFSQNRPGVNLYPVTVDMRISKSLLNCYRESYNSIQMQGHYHTTVLIGCPPAQYVEFDWKRSISYLEKMDKNDSHSSDCLYPSPSMRCFYFKDAFYPFFKVFDMATGNSKPYDGNFTLLIVYAADNMNDSGKRYTDEEILKYNNLDGSTSGLIWKPEHEIHVHKVDGWPVYNKSSNKIKWYCLWDSPCAHINPSFPKSPEMYFLVEFSNALVSSSDTMCNHTYRFWIHVHGLQIDSLQQKLPIVGCVLLMVLLFLLIFFVCHRNGMAVYHSTESAFAKFTNR